MEKDRLIFKNGEAVPIESGASLGSIQVFSESKEDMLSAWNQFAEENLSEVQIENKSGLTIGSYHDLVLTSETSSVRPDGSVLTTYSLREKTAEERRLDALEQGQEVQDNAITELAEMAAGGEM